jgi:hypothetical protein
VAGQVCICLHTSPLSRHARGGSPREKLAHARMDGSTHISVNVGVPFLSARIMSSFKYLEARK